LALGDHGTQRAYRGALKLLADPAKDHLPSASHIAIGNALLGSEQFAQARDAFQKSVTLYPNDARTLPLAQLGLANADLNLNQLDDAENSFNQVLAANPQGPLFAAAQLGIAEVCLARGRGKGPMDPQNVLGIELLNKVMAATESDTASKAAYELGNYFFQFTDNEKDNKKTALAYYLRVALQAGGPIGEEAAFRTGECHQALGNIEAARSAYLAYLRRFPNGQFSEQAKKELEALPVLPEQS
jgi:TolA-binding protein